MTKTEPFGRLKPLMGHHKEALLRLKKSVTNQGGHWIKKNTRKNTYWCVNFEKDERVLAHRASFLLFKGPIPAGMCVLHKCDIPACVRPSHLWLGTKGDNNWDRALKGRNRVPKRERIYQSPVSKINWARATCKHCHGEFLIRKLMLDRGERKFCGRACANKHNMHRRVIAKKDQSLARWNAFRQKIWLLQNEKCLVCSCAHLSIQVMKFKVTTPQYTVVHLKSPARRIGLACPACWKSIHSRNWLRAAKKRIAKRAL